MRNALVTRSRMNGRTRSGSTFAALFDLEHSPYPYILPSILFLLFLTVLPLTYALYLSLNTWSLFHPERGMRFVFLENYLTMLKDWRFWGALKNTAIFMLIAVSLEVVLGMSIALLLNKSFRGKAIVNTLIMLPMVATPVVVALVWRELLQPSFGWIPYFFARVGITLPPLLSGKNTALLSLAVIDAWQWTPFMVLMLVAGLESIPKEIYEAAKMDGASFFKTLRNITIPLLYPVLSITLVFRLVDSTKLFDSIVLTTRGGPGTATEVLNYYIYLKGLVSGAEITYATAMALVLSNINVLIASYILRAPYRENRIL